MIPIYVHKAPPPGILAHLCNVYGITYTYKYTSTYIYFIMSMKWKSVFQLDFLKRLLRPRLNSLFSFVMFYIFSSKKTHQRKKIDFCTFKEQHVLLIYSCETSTRNKSLPVITSIITVINTGFLTSLSHSSVLK